jgi:uncharacterized protein
MKIVVFGATGMIGTRIAAELEQRGHAVTAATRAPAQMSLIRSRSPALPPAPTRWSVRSRRGA